MELYKLAHAKAAIGRQLMNTVTKAVGKVAPKVTTDTQTGSKLGNFFSNPLTIFGIAATGAGAGTYGAASYVMRNKAD
jgi:hypothetical protein